MLSRLIPTTNSNLHFVLCDFGRLGTAYVETDPTKADRDTIIHNLTTGQYDHPLRVIAINPAAGWSRDVSEDIARAVLKTAERDHTSLSAGAREFVESQIGIVVADA